jgi:hypothetical protein
MIRLLNVYVSGSGFLGHPGVAGAGIQSKAKIWFYSAESWEAQSCLSDLRGSSGRGDWVSQWLPDGSFDKPPPPLAPQGHTVADP